MTSFIPKFTAWQTNTSDISINVANVPAAPPINGTPGTNGTAPTGGPTPMSTLNGLGGS